MRRAILPVVLVISFATAAVLPGCSEGGGGSGKFVTETKEIAGFTGVAISGPFEADIKRADNFSVTINVRSTFLDYVTVNKAGDTLKVSLAPRHVFTDFPIQPNTFKVNITMPALTGISLSGATKASISGFKSSQDFRIEISGASSLDMESVEAGNVASQLSGASRLTGGLRAKELDLTVSGASKIDMEGSADNLLLIASGASNIDLLDFPLNQADVRISGASEADVDVKMKLDLSLTDASRLYFRGNPTVGNMSISGASTVKQK
ncbi:MAG: DUF2807 domain-containing protein [Chloroflexi bacterium]|nr:DUF2807 domain-containing protein [Chloroflexota bacterium]